MKNLEVYEKVCGDLKRTGDDWFMTNCPYPDHEDRKASFKINEAGYFSCFGCNARGDSYVFAKDFGYDPTPYARGLEPKAAISRLLPLFYPQKQARWTTIAHIIKLRLDKSTIDQGLNTLASNYLQLA